MSMIRLYSLASFKATALAESYCNKNLNEVDKSEKKVQITIFSQFKRFTDYVQ